MATWPGASTITDLTGQVFVCSSGAANKSEIAAAAALAGLAAVSSDVAAVRTSLAVAGTGVANTFSTGPQVFVGGATVRQSGGTAGVDEAQLTHDGTDLLINNMEVGKVRVGVGRGGNNDSFRVQRADFPARYIDFTPDLNGIAAQISSSFGLFWFGSRVIMNQAAITWSNGGGVEHVGLDRAGSFAVLKITNASTGGGTLSSIPLTPAQITSNQNNYAPGVARFYRLSTDASRDITGLSISQVDGQEFEIWNVGSNNLVLKHQDAASTAANRFICTGAADITLAADEIALARYDSTTARFRVRKV